MQFESYYLPLGNLSLMPNSIELWALNMTGLPGPPGSVLSKNMSNEGSRLEALQQQRFLQRFYLRLILASYLETPAANIRIKKTSQGKPFVEVKGKTLACPPLYFSLSHVGQQWLLAICAEHPVGVDMERLDRDIRQPLRIARRYFHPLEVDWLTHLEIKEMKSNWLRLWTCKEAVVKATGGGIVSGLDRFAVSMTGSTPNISSIVNADEYDLLHQLELHQFMLDEQHTIALACHPTIKHVNGRHLKLESR